MSQHKHETAEEIAHKDAFRAFGQEFDHLRTAEHLRSVGNHKDANGFQETADMCLDLGWETLSTIGMRPRDIAKFRHASQEQWEKRFPFSLPVDVIDDAMNKLFRI